MIKVCPNNIGHNIGHNIGQFLFKLLIFIKSILGHNIGQIIFNEIWMTGNIYQEI